MPTYTYQCQKCDNLFDVFHAMSATPKLKCEACGSAKTKRLIGTGAGIIFKGSGFYETDYKKSGKKEASGGSDAKSESKSESKPETKTESKPKKGKSGGEAA
ncbi:MAG: zinc ribbon domain-containing protein [Candidatus Hydrogenedentes bacterium]|nr:zinc ribbon domain-containing protein [Candidatus Hydrogenedentota bacterium]